MDRQNTGQTSFFQEIERMVAGSGRQTQASRIRILPTHNSRKPQAWSILTQRQPLKQPPSVNPRVCFRNRRDFCGPGNTLHVWQSLLASTVRKRLLFPHYKPGAELQWGRGKQRPV